MDIIAAPEDSEFVAELRDKLAARGTLDNQSFVFVLSPEFVASTGCLDALHKAVADNRVIVPVLRRNVDPAAMPPELVPYQAIPFLQPETFAPGLDELVERLGAGLNFDAFISYSRHDMQAVDELVAGLWRAGKSTWVDRSKLLASEQWRQALLAGIEASDHFVFVMSPESVSSEFCQLELGHAVASLKRIIPVTLREVAPSVLPTILAERQWVEFGVEAVVRALDVDPEWRRSHTDLLRRAHAWALRDNDRGSLLRGRELAAAEAWLKEAGKQPERNPTPLQTELILESRRGATRRLRILIASVTSALLVALGLAGVAVYFWRAQILETKRAFENAAEAHVEEALGRGAENEALAWARHIPATMTNAGRVSRALSTGAAYTLIPATDDRHRGAMAWSADGARFAFGQSDSTVIVWQTNGGSQVKLGKPAPAPEAWIPMHLAFSPDGRTLAVYDHSGVVTLWNVDAATHVATLEDVRYNEPRALLWSGIRLAVGGDGRACVYDTGESPPKLLRCRAFDGRSAVAWSHDTSALLSVSGLGEVAVWYPDSDLWTRIESDVPATVGAFAPNGEPARHRVVVGTRDRRLQAYSVTPQGVKLEATSSVVPWRLGAGELEMTEDLRGDAGRYRIHSRIQDVQWCHEGDCVAYRLGGSVGLWLLTGDAVLLSGDDVEAMAWSPEGTRLARISQYDVRIAAPRTSYQDQRTKAFRGRAPALSWDPSGRWLALVSHRAPLELWDTRSSPSRLLQGPVPNPRGIATNTTWFTGLVVSHDGQRVAAGGSGGSVGIWAADGSVGTLLEGEDHFAPAVAWSPVATTLAYVNARGDLFLRAISGPEQVRRVPGSGKRAWQIAWSPDGGRVAWGSPDHLAIWSADKGDPVIVEGAVEVAGFAWSPNGTRLASVHANGVIDLRDPTGLPLSQLGEPGEERKRRVEWAREDSLMVFFDDAAFPRLDVWNPATGSHWKVDDVTGGARWSTAGVLAVGSVAGLRFFTPSGAAARPEVPVVYVSPNDRVEVIAWSPSGRQLAFNGDPGLIVVLDVITGERCTLSGHADKVIALGWHPDGDWLASSAADGTVRRWPALWIDSQLRAALENRSNWRVGDDQAAHPEAFRGLPQTQ
jgi:WD40 repeat protein